MSASVTVYSVVKVSDLPGARLVIVHASPVSSSVTVMSVRVRLPSLVAVIL